MERTDLFAKGIIGRFIHYIKQFGLKYSLTYGFIKLFAPVFVVFYGRKKDKFIFKGNEHYYFYHHYNVTWAHERIIEIPIFKKILDENRDKQILEVGNVMSHYFPIEHDVVDKYEKGKNVIEQDILEYKPNKKYDIIVSISTFEHIGWDEHPRDSHKIKTVLNHLKTLLNENGCIIFSIPMNYNPPLDRMIFNNEIVLNEKTYLKRISKDKWIEVNENEAKNIIYGKPYYCANGVLIGKIE